MKKTNKKRKSCIENSLKRTKLILIIFISFFINYFLRGQAESKYYEKGDLFELLHKNQLSEIKSGLINTSERNDTIFSIFYAPGFNSIVALPIGTKKVDNEYFFYDNINHTFGNRALEMSEYFWSSGLEFFLSRTVGQLKLGFEEVVIIEQLLSYHETLKASDRPEDFSAKRFLYYSKERGVFQIEYATTHKEKEFIWPYYEGDFFIQHHSFDRRHNPPASKGKGSK